MIGWQCPRCGRCYSNYLVMCPYCQPTGDATNTTGTSYTVSQSDATNTTGISYTVNGVLYDGEFWICVRCGKKVRVEEHECSSRVLCVAKQNNK